MSPQTKSNAPINQTGITKFQSRSTAPGILRHSLTGPDSRWTAQVIQSEK